jgi:hypothetical protein
VGTADDDSDATFVGAEVENRADDALSATTKLGTWVGTTGNVSHSSSSSSMWWWWWLLLSGACC